MSLDLKPIYKEIVENVFNRWTALKLAVEHGMGGSNGLEVSQKIQINKNPIHIKNCFLESN